jgi:hypothetical protein
MSGGRITLAIYIAIGITGAAFGQSSTHVKTPVPTIGVVKPAVPAQVGIERQHPGTTIIIKYGRGGRMDEHTMRFADYRLSKARVEIRGPCLSACTIVLAYVGPELLCVAEGGYMAFHQVRSAERGEGMPLETRFLYSIYPEPVRDWIDRKGGWQKLPLNGFWDMSDRELWAMGYPKCP